MTMSHTGLLAKLVQAESERLPTVLPPDQFVRKHILLEAVRAQDNAFHEAVNGKQEVFQWYAAGWSKALQILMGTHCTIPAWRPYPHSDESWNDANRFLMNAARLAHAERLLLMVHAGLAKITERPEQSRIEIRYAHGNTNAESADVEAQQEFLRRRYEAYHASELRLLESSLSEIRPRMRAVVRPWQDDLIQYQYNDQDIDDYFELKAHHMSARMVGADDFNPSARFGGIRYADYCSMAKLQLSVHLKHTEFCNLFIKKTGHRHPPRLYSLVCDMEEMATDASIYTGLARTEVYQMLRTLLWSANNSESYEDTHISPPPFIQMAGSTVIRSSHGMSQMFHFMSSSLKEMFPKDYFEAVNERESRLIDELTVLLRGEKVHIGKNLVIRGNAGATDIDAFVYDEHSRTLALFQLKWQDHFGLSLRTRRSRISNFIPKAVEWINKVQSWYEEQEWSTLVTLLKLPKGTPEPTFRLFVLNRNNVHFTGEALDDRAVWCTWHQLLESRERAEKQGRVGVAELHFDLQQRHSSNYTGTFRAPYSFKLRDHEIAVIQE